MTATKIHPLHIIQQVAEFVLKRRKRSIQRLESLFAQGMEMQATDALQILSGQFTGWSTQREQEAQGSYNSTSPSECSGFTLSPRNSSGDESVTKTLQLSDRVKDEMIGNIDQFGHIAVFKRRAEDVYLTGIVVPCQLRLMHTGGATAG